MALTVGTNSYVDVAESDLYFADRLYATAWTGAVSGDKTKALLSAMLVLEPLCAWNYSKTDPDQALMFPRGGETVVPNNVKIAQMEIALEMLSQDVVSFVEEADELKQLKAGSASLSFYEKLANPISIINSITKSMLAPLGMCSFGGGSVTAVKMVR